MALDDMFRKAGKQGGRDAANFIGGKPMCPWLTGDDKARLMGVLQHRAQATNRPPEELIRAKMDLDAVEAQTKAALAEERAAIASEIAAKASVQNAKYMLWSVFAAAVSAIASLATVVFAAIWHH